MRILACLVAFAGLAAAAPDFSGTWKMNAAKSDFGPAPGPSSMVRVVRHEEPKIHIKTTQTTPRGEMVTNLTYTTDGKESINSTRAGDIKATAKWKGDALIVEYTVNSPQAGELKVQDRWSLADGGKTTVVESTIAGGLGSFERRVVFEKQ